MGIGQFVLQAQSCPALLGCGHIAALAFAASGIGHGVAFVEEDHPIEVLPKPVDDLIDTGFLGPTLLRTQRCVGGKEDAFGERNVAALRKTRERRHEQPFLAKRQPVALRIL